jgi:hypothetical protein
MINKVTSGVLFLISVSNVNSYAQNPGDVVVNEILYNAPASGSGKEWFEIYNKSTNAVNLNGWRWKDGTGTLRMITNQNVTLNAGGFAVVCEDSAALRTFYPAVTGLLLQSSGWNGLNNTGDQVVIQTSSGLTIDSVSYLPSWGGASNISLERILASGPSNQQSNWGSCVSPAGATPNLRNSITPRSYDLALNIISFSPSSPAIGDTLRIISNVKNRGTQTANTFSVAVYDDFNRDSIPQPNELIGTVNSSFPLNPNDSMNMTLTDVPDSAGFRQYISKVNFAQDEDTLNNKKVAGINVTGGSSAGSVIVNEIMYKFPAGECEWIELYNSSDSIVNLKNWRMKDLNPTAHVITSQDYFLYPDSFVVISDNENIFSRHPGLLPNKVIVNSSLPALNDDEDAIIVIKLNGSAADSVYYKDDWGGNQVSLERISATGGSNDSANWTSSLDCEKSSPARVNSITGAVHYSYHDLILNEINFSPDTGNAEWIELYNPTNQTIDISGWQMFETTRGYSIADTCRAIIKPGMYVVFASDNRIFNRFSYLSNPDSTRRVFIRSSGSDLGLNNDGDMVKIIDLFKDMIDSVYYLDDWHNPNLPSITNVSLEKINPSLPPNDKSSWSSSANPIGGTPGLQNSIYTKVLPPAGEISVSPNPFSPDNDGFEDFAVISYKLTSIFSQARVKIYDVKGRLVRTLLNNQTVGSSGTIVFDGLDDGRQKLRIGIYIIFFEALNDQNGVVQTLKTTVVVAAKL